MNEQERARRMMQYQKLLAHKVAESGWVVQGVFPRQGHPEDGGMFAYTIGLHAAGLPELILSAPAAPEFLQHVLNGFAKRHLANEIKPGDRIGYKELEVSHELQVTDQQFQVIEAVNAPAYQAEAFAGKPVRVLQLLWPDDEGRYPGEEGYQDDGEQEVWAA